MKQHVVIADDVAAVRALVRAALERDGRFVVVGEAADGPETIEQVDTLGPDLLVLDLGMPGTDGVATTAEIAARHPDLGIVVYSELVDEEPAVLAVGARAFVRKSAEIGELLDTLVAEAERVTPRPFRLEQIRDFQHVVLDALDEGFVVHDAAGRIVYANPAAERILDLRAHAMLGLTSSDARWGAVDAHGAAVPSDEHPIVTARVTGRPVHDVLMGVRRPNADLRWLQVSAAPLIDGAGEAPVGAVALFNDVTEELGAKQALRASEERFRTAVETMLDGFIIWRAVRDERGRIVDFACEFANAAVARSGYTPSALAGRRLLDLSPRLSDADFARCVQVVETGAPLHLEVPWLEGTVVRGVFDVSAVRMGDGIASTYRDVTERANSERALRESEEQTRRFLEAIPVGIAVVEPGDVVLLNERGREILGRDLDTEVRGPELVEHFRLRRAGTGELYPFEELPLYRALYGGVVSRADDMVVARDDRDVPVETYAAPVRDAQGEVKFALTIFSDVTERAAQETRLARALAELAAANEELTQFAAVAAHDLAAPLRAIAGFAELLDSAYSEAIGEPGREWIGYLIAESARMRGLIEELLAYSRAGAANTPMDEVDLGSVAEAARDALRVEIAETRACVEIDHLPVVAGDATRLGQVLQNLLANAIKFRRHGSGPTVRVDAERHADEWIVTVADDGVGVPEADRDRIFAPFHRGRTDGQPAGHGLGLSICRRVVDCHGGRIWVEPAAGGGSRVRFSLPAAARPDERDPDR